MITVEVPEEATIACYRLCYYSLGPHEDLLFPCDASGHVALDALESRELVNFLFARALVGLHFSPPSVLRTAP